MAQANRRAGRKMRRNLVEGIELTRKDLTAALIGHQIKPVPGLWRKIQIPMYHQAVAQHSASRLWKKVMSPP